MQDEDDNSAANPPRNSRVFSAKSVDVADCESSREQSPKLCGYLNKFAGKGPLKGFRTRWFVYDPRKCYLYFFKTPNDTLPLGHIDIADACFTYDVEGEEGQFEVRTAGKEFLLKAPNKQVMHYWLQQLQQKRWEFSNTRGCGNRDSLFSPTVQYPHTGLVAKDADAVLLEQPNENMESVRSDFAVEADANGLVGLQTARNTATLNFSLKQWSTDLRHSMSHLRPSRVGENRRSVFYTASNEEWEMVDPPMKDTPEHKPPAESPRRESPAHFHRHSLGSAFTFDFRNPSRIRRPFGLSKTSRSGETSPVECNGNKTSELQLRLQNQQEELRVMQEEHVRLQEELTSQKVQKGVRRVRWMKGWIKSLDLTAIR